MAAFAILTAWNPGSVLRPEPENQVQNTLMERQLRTVAKCVLPATSIGDLGDWPAEEGFFAAGIDPESAIQLAAEFGQNALVFCKTGESPELWWLEGTEE